MGASRQWNGAEANYILISGQGTSGNISCQCAWIQVDALGTLGTIFGNRYDAGYAMQINASDELQLSFQQAGVIYYLTSPLTIAAGATENFLQAGVPLFVAINVTHSQAGSPPVTADFYAGQTPSTVSLIGSDSAGTFIASNGVQRVHVGGNNFGAAAPPAPTFDAFSGYLSNIRCWNINLSLSELRAEAACDSIPSHNVTGDMHLAFSLAITGADPEPNDVVAGNSGTIVGSLPAGPDLCQEDQHDPTPTEEPPTETEPTPDVGGGVPSGTGRTAGHYLPGGKTAICDRCGFRFRVWDLSREWTGHRVCSVCFDPMPADLAKGLEGGVILSAPAPDDLFVEPGDITPADL